jgi:hypothetical protein
MTVGCTVTGDGSGLVATLTGLLSLAEVAKVRTQLFKCLAEQPDVLFVDLAGLTVDDPLALAVFSAVSRQAARWPAIPVVYFRPGRALREMLAGGAYRRLPVADTVELARESVHADRQSVPSLIDDLLPISGAARQARNIATEACARWDLPDLIAPASMITSELVTNVIEHASTMATLRISLRPRFMTIGVRDGSTEEPRRISPGRHGGRGLMLVEARAHSWGWLPVDGGKVVWASLSRRPEAPSPTA